MRIRLVAAPAAPPLPRGPGAPPATRLPRQRKRTTTGQLMSFSCPRALATWHSTPLRLPRRRTAAPPPHSRPQATRAPTWRRIGCALPVRRRPHVARSPLRKLPPRRHRLAPPHQMQAVRCFRLLRIVTRRRQLRSLARSLPSRRSLTQWPRPRGRLLRLRWTRRLRHSMTRSESAAGEFVSTPSSAQGTCDRLATPGQTRCCNMSRARRRRLLLRRPIACVGSWLPLRIMSRCGTKEST